LDLVGHLGHVPANTSGQHTDSVVFCEAICLPLWLWRDQLRGSRLVVVVAGPAWYEGRAHASPVGSHLASNTLACAGSCLALSLDRSITAGGLSGRDTVCLLEAGGVPKY
jgi:hypothetical protein